jgi:hypothetical protein
MIKPLRARQTKVCSGIFEASGRHTQAADGAAGAFLRIIMRYPEVLAWDHHYRLVREEIGPRAWT